MGRKYSIIFGSVAFSVGSAVFAAAYHGHEWYITIIILTKL